MTREYEAAERKHITLCDNKNLEQVKCGGSHFNPNTWKTKAGRSLWVQSQSMLGQTELHNETLSPANKQANLSQPQALEF